MESSPNSIVESLLSAFDIDSTESVPLEYGTGCFEVLDRPHRETIYSELTTRLPAEDVDSVRRLSYSWKNGSYCDEGQTLEAIFNEALHIDRPLRGNDGELSGRVPQGEEITIASVLYDLSQSYLQHHHEDSVAYRGIYTYDGLVEAVLEVLDPEKSGTTIDTTKLSNFTLDRETADHHGNVIVAVDLEPAQVAFAADFYVPHSETDPDQIPAADQITKNEAELRMIGDRLPTIPIEDVSVADVRTPVTTLFDPTASNSIEEHEYAAGIIRTIAEANKTLPELAKDDVEEWFYQYFQADPGEGLELKDKVERVLDRSIDIG